MPALSHKSWKGLGFSVQIGGRCDLQSYMRKKWRHTAYGEKCLANDSVSANWRNWSFHDKPNSVHNL